MRRIVTTLSVLAAAAMTLIATASAASARLLVPTGGTASDPTATQIVHYHAGLFAWQIALIVVAAALLVGIASTLVARQGRIGSRRPAIS
jgi:hypothetical protein